MAFAKKGLTVDGVTMPVAYYPCAAEECSNDGYDFRVFGPDEIFLKDGRFWCIDCLEAERECENEEEEEYIDPKDLTSLTQWYKSRMSPADLPRVYLHATGTGGSRAISFPS